MALIRPPSDLVPTNIVKAIKFGHFSHRDPATGISWKAFLERFVALYGSAG
jgi:hypothetical protein